MHKQDKQFADLLNSAKSIDQRIANNPDFKGEKPDNTPLPSLIPAEDDEFGGNENNRRVAERKAKTKQVVEGEAKQEDLDRLTEEQRKEVLKATTAATATDTYETNKVPDGAATGSPVWKPNS